MNLNTMMEIIGFKCVNCLKFNVDIMINFLAKLFGQMRQTLNRKDS